MVDGLMPSMNSGYKSQPIVFVIHFIDAINNLINIINGLRLLPLLYIWWGHKAPPHILSDKLNQLLITHLLKPSNDSCGV